MAEETEKTAKIEHTPVLLDEVLTNLELKGKRIVVDATVGLAGHSKEIVEKLPKNGKLVAFDADKEHVKEAKKRLKKYKDRVTVIHSNFKNLAEEIGKLKLRGIDAILFDLGLASPHVDNPERGFSFLQEGPLDMRFDIKQDFTAADIINTYTEKELIRIFQQYGEERFARKIAREILVRRKKRKFKTTKDLSKVIEKLIKRQGRIHPATRVFQALRIEVNGELDVLQEALKQSVELLRKGGRIEVISYHSLEDRIVKRFFKEQALDYINFPEEDTTTKLTPTLKIVTKKPITPSDKEISENPRSRSAKLRVAEKV
ncbi:16S rRNA (cytosine(1402)-N(4))-methyltransferase RsmH [Pseudomonadota bacterium]